MPEKKRRAITRLFITFNTFFIFNALRNLKLLLIFGLTLIFIGTAPTFMLAYIWDIQTVEHWGDHGIDNSIALDSLGRAHISYREFDYLRITNYLKYAYYNGNEWQTQYVDWTEDTGFYSSLALDSSDQPCISYHEEYYIRVADTLQFQSRLKFAKLSGSVWQIVTVDDTGGMPSNVRILGRQHLANPGR